MTEETNVSPEGEDGPRVEVVENSEQEEHPEGQDPLAKVRREAAGWRTKLREAEEQRDQLATRLVNMQRAEAARLAATPADEFPGLADGGDLWRDDTDLTELVADDGTVDPDRVRERAQVLGEAHPHWVAVPRATGDGDAGKGAAPMPAVEFADGFRAGR